MTSGKQQSDSMLSFQKDYLCKKNGEQTLTEYVNYLKQFRHGETALLRTAQNATNLSSSLLRGTLSYAIQPDPDWNRDKNYRVLRHIGERWY